MAEWLVNPKTKRRRRSRRRMPAGLRRYWASHRRKRTTTRRRRRRNPGLTEYGMMGLLGNPRRRHRRHHRRRHTYRHNPRHRSGGFSGGGIMSTIKNPLPYVTNGAFGILGAWATITVPNAFLPFPGTDIGSKLLRLLTRVGAGSLAFWAARRFMPRSAHAVLVGSTIAAAGSFLFDLLGTQLVIGAGDTAQTPGTLFGSLSIPGITGSLPAGMSAYSRAQLAAAHGLSAYSRAQLPSAGGMSGVFGRGSAGMITHGIFGNN